MYKAKDLTGKTFNQLTVIGFDCKKKYNNGKYQNYWLCKCECGNIKSVSTVNLTKGRTKSCGCILKRNSGQTKHGLTKERIYNEYHNMKSRIYCSSRKDHKWYENISICEQWLDKKYGFLNFVIWAYNNGYNDSLTLDRINSNGNYEPSNCRWITIQKQQQNKRNNRYVIYNNEKICVSEFARRINATSSQVIYRLNNCFTVEDIEEEFNKD